MYIKLTYSIAIVVLSLFSALGKAERLIPETISEHVRAVWLNDAMISEMEIDQVFKSIAGLEDNFKAMKIAGAETYNSEDMQSIYHKLRDEFMIVERYSDLLLESILPSPQVELYEKQKLISINIAGTVRDGVKDLNIEFERESFLDLSQRVTEILQSFVDHHVCVRKACGIGFRKN